METKNNGRALHRGTVEFVNGPVIKAAGMRDFGMREVVHVGPKKLRTFGSSYLYPVFVRLGVICLDVGWVGSVMISFGLKWK